MLTIYLTGLGLLLLATAFVAFFLRLFRHASGANLPASGWLDEFSLEKYRPLERLFDSEEKAFVEAQPGYTAALGRQFASSRRMVARLYLSELTVDFDRLFRMGREMVATSRVDRPDLASQLLKLWLTFHLQVTRLRIRLLLAPLGLAAPRPAGLFDALARMRSVVAVLDVPSLA